jgi:hypothetical protein
MLTPRFRLFNRKTDFSNVESESNDSQSPTSISISNGLSLLNAIMVQNTQELCSKLSIVRDNVLRSLKSVEKLAKELEIEKIKIEETRFEPIVENSKRTVVSSLRRECSLDIPQPNSYPEAIKFNQRLEALTSRFREVSTSHNRVFNVFIKKYAGKLKDEFETLSSHSKEVTVILNEFEEQQKPFSACTGLLQMISEENISITREQQRLQDHRTELNLFENRLRELNLQMVDIENSVEFREYLRANDEIKQVEQKKVESHKELVHLFSPISRALTKYSYGISGETLNRVHAMSDEPWVILSEKEIRPFLDILGDVQSGISTEKIQLKDAPKVLRHLDNLIKDLPSIRRKYQAIQLQLVSLYQRRNAKFDRRSSELKEEIKRTSRDIDERTTDSSQLESLVKEKRLHLAKLHGESEECLCKIFGKKYNLLI